MRRVQITYVGEIESSAFDSANTSFSLTTFGYIPAGSFVVFAIGSPGGGHTVTGITDTKGNTWNIDKTVQNTQSVHIMSCVLTKPIVGDDVGGTDAINVTFAGSGLTNVLWWLQQFAGTTGVADKTSSNFSSSSTTSPTTGSSGTLSSPNDLVVAVVASGGNFGSWTKDASFSNPVNPDYVSRVAFQYKITFTNAAVNAGGSFSTAQAWIAAEVTYPGAPVITDIVLDIRIPATATVSGAVTKHSGLTLSQINATSTVSGSLSKPSKQILPGQVSATATVSGAVAKLAKFITPANVSATSTASGSVVRKTAVVSANVAATSTVSGRVNALKRVAPAQVTATSTVSGAISKHNGLNPAQINATSTISGAVIAFKRISVTQVSAASTVSGTVATQKLLRLANVVATSSLSGKVAAKKSLKPTSIAATSWVEPFKTAQSYTLTFLTFGAGNANAHSSGTVACDSGNQVFNVDDLLNKSVQFDGVTGTYVTRYPNLALDGTHGVVDAFDCIISPFDGNLYVTDPHGGKVPYFSTSTGRWIANIGLGPGIHGPWTNAYDISELESMVIDGSGNVYIYDDDLGRTTKWSAAGAYIGPSPVGGSFTRAWAVNWTGQFFDSDGIMHDAAGTFVKQLVDGTGQIFEGLVYIPPASANSHIFYMVQEGSDLIKVHKFTQSGAWVDTYLLSTDIMGNDGHLVNETNYIDPADGATFHNLYDPNFCVSGDEQFLYLNTWDKAGIYKYPLVTNPAIEILRRISTSQVSATSTVSGLVVRKLRPVPAQISATSSVSGAVVRLGTTRSLTASQINATSTVSGVVTARKAITPSQVSATSTVSGAVAKRAAIKTAQVSATSTASGAVTALHKISTTQVSAVSTVSGFLSRKYSLIIAQISATSTVSGSVVRLGTIRPVTTSQISATSTVSGTAAVQKLIRTTQISATSTTSGTVTKRAIAKAAQISATSTVGSSFAALRRIFPSQVSATSTVSCSINTAGHKLLTSGNVFATSACSGVVIKQAKVRNASVTSTSTVSATITKLALVRTPSVSATSTVSSVVTARRVVLPAQISAFTTLTGQVRVSRRVLPSAMLATSTVSGVVRVGRGVKGGAIHATSTVSGRLNLLNIWFILPATILATTTVSISIIKVGIVEGPMRPGRIDGHARSGHIPGRRSRSGHIAREHDGRASNDLRIE